MNIGTKIKNLRREREITQEELAEMLGITSRAVSQWECGRTAPDISQLPIIARIFGVTTDHLLDVDIGRIEEEIADIVAEMQEHYAVGDFGRCVTILRAGLAKYPASHLLMVNLADVLSISGGAAEEIETLCTRVISESTDRSESDFAHVVLIAHYRNAGKKDVAVRMAKGLSHTWNSREDHLMHLLEGEEAQKNLAEYVDFCAGRVMISMQKLADSPGYTEEDKISLFESVEKIAEAVHPLEDLKFDAQFPAMATLETAKLYARRGESEAALEALRRMCGYVREFDTYDTTAPYTSPAVRGYVSGGWIRSDGETFSASIRKQMAECPEFESLHGREEYKSVLAVLGE